MLFSEPKIPQSSSPYTLDVCRSRFSALQRAENSSIATDARTTCGIPAVSVLFSEPKIPQSNSANGWRRAWRVSVLFSEPKIPQSRAGCGRV